jgi:hypothetical protein
MLRTVPPDAIIRHGPVERGRAGTDQGKPQTFGVVCLAQGLDAVTIRRSIYASTSHNPPVLTALYGALCTESLSRKLLKKPKF